MGAQARGSGAVAGRDLGREPRGGWQDSGRAGGEQLVLGSAHGLESIGNEGGDWQLERRLVFSGSIFSSTFRLRA